MWTSSMIGIDFQVVCISARGLRQAQTLVQVQMRTITYRLAGDSGHQPLLCLDVEVQRLPNDIRERPLPAAVAGTNTNGSAAEHVCNA